MSKLNRTIIGLTTVIWLSGAIAFLPMTANAAALTQSQINAIVSLLQSFGADQSTINNVQTSLSGGTPSVTTPTGYTFSVNLKLGSKGTDVTNLQTVLKSDASVYPEGLVTGNFGNLTKAAVIKFQTKYGISPVAGYVGALTRAKLNALYGGGTTGGTGGEVVIPAGTGLTVTAAATQPVATLAPLNASRVPFTVVNFTASSDGDVTVSSIVVERTGLAADTTLSGIILLDENGLQLGLEKTLNSVHQVTLSEPFVVKAGQTRKMTLAGNRPSAAVSHSGEIAYLSLVSVNTSANVNGSLPITGTGQTTNETLTIGSITQAKGPLDPGTTATKEVGTTGYTFSSIRITSGSAEKVRLSSIRWNQSGSAAKDDLANVKTYIDGTAYDAVVSSDGKYYTSTFGNGIVIDKGFSSEISVKGDIVSGSARTIIFDVYKTTDLYLKGETYGYGILPAAGIGTTDGTFTASQPWYNAYQVTVSAGSLSVSKNTQFSAQNIAVNLADQPLGAFDIEAKGEAVSVASMIFTAASSSGATGTGYLTNVSMYDENGKIVAGPVDGTGWSASGQTLTFADTVTFPIGKHTYTIKGKVASDTSSNEVYSVSTTPSTSSSVAGNWTTVKGQNTGITIYPTPYTAVAANAVTVKAGALVLSVSTFPLAQTVIAGVTQFTFANYVLNAGNSGEDVSVNSIKLSYSATSTTHASELTNCKLYDGTTAITTGSNAVTPTLAASNTQFTFDAPLTITKGTSKTVALKCDIAGNTYAGTIWQWGYGYGASTADAAAYLTPTGKTSGQTITETFPLTAAAAAGQVMTSAAGGTYTVVDDSTPGYSIIAAGTTGATLLKLKFVASNEDIDIYKVDLYLPGVVATSTRNDLVNQTLSLYNADYPTKVIATAQFNQTDARFASSTLIAAGDFRVPSGSYKTILVKGDIAAINYSQGPLQASGDLLQIGYLANDPGTSGNYGKGVYSGTTINDGTLTNVTSTGVRIMKSYPTFAKLSLPTQLLQTTSGATLYRFSVKANAGDVYLYKLSLTVSSSSLTATTTKFGLYAYTDSAFSQGDSTFSTDGLLNAGNLLGTVGAKSPLTCTAPYAQIAPVELYMAKTVGATTTYKIPSGETRYFAFKADVCAVESTASVTEYITIKLEGDSTYPVNAATTMGQAGTATGQIDADDHDDFIWSPNSTSSNILLGDIDFTNGYSVPGLPTTFMDTETMTSAN